MPVRTTSTSVLRSAQKTIASKSSTAIRPFSQTHRKTPQLSQPREGFEYSGALPAPEKIYKDLAESNRVEAAKDFARKEIPGAKFNILSALRNPVSKPETK